MALILAVLTWAYLANSRLEKKRAEAGTDGNSACQCACHHQTERSLIIEGVMYARYGYDLILISELEGRKVTYHILKWEPQLPMRPDPRCTYRAKLKVGRMESAPGRDLENAVEEIGILEMAVVS